MEQRELIPEIKRLCMAREYDSAIALTDQIQNKEIAVKAHLLCVEHEVNWLRSQGVTV